MKKQMFVLLLALVLLFTTLSSCAKTGSGSAESTAANAETGSTTGGEHDSLVISIGGGVGGAYDPIRGYGSSGVGIFHTALLKINVNVEVEKDLASAYEVSDDGLVYTYTIRDDVKFSDGTQLTPEDVVFTYLSAKESGSSVDLTVLESAVVVDGNKVKFTLQRVFSPFVRQTALLGIVPEHAYGDNYAENPIGTGPFKVKQLDVGQQLIVEPNEYYYGVKSPFKQITFLSLDEEVALAAAKSGELDVVMINPEYALETVPGMHLETILTSDNRGFNLPQIPETVNDNGATIGNNVTSDPAVRNALNIGIDRQIIINNALNGIGTPSHTYFQGLPWGNDEPVFVDGRVDEAKALLEAAGWTDTDGDGVREKNGVKAEFHITGRTDDLQRYNLAVAFAENAKQLGVNIIAEAVDWTSAKERARNAPTCIGTGSYTYLDVSPAFHSSYSEPNGTSYLGSSLYDNHAVDGYIEEMLAARSDSEAIELAKKAQYDGVGGANVDLPYIWLVNIDHTYFVRDGLSLGVQRIHPHGHGSPVIQNLNEWAFN